MSAAAKHSTRTLLMGIGAIGGIAYAAGRVGWNNKRINDLPAEERLFEVEEARIEAMQAGASRGEADKIVELKSKGGDHTRWGR